MKSATHPDGVDMSHPENQDTAVFVQTNILCEILNMSKARSNCNTSELIISAANDKINSSSLPVLSNEEYKTLLHLDFSSSKYQRALPGFIALYQGMTIIFIYYKIECYISFWCIFQPEFKNALKWCITMS
jgi:hypothetical protein